MKTKIPLLLLAATLACGAARAQSEASALSALSTLPLASVVVGASAAVVALPVALSTAGAVLVVRTVESTARGTVIVVERASDGASASIEVAGRTAQSLAIGVGTTLAVSVVGAGVLLSAAGEVIAFIPNTLGQALLHDERLTY